MARRDASPDFIEAVARGLDVIRAFQPRQPVMSLTAVATAVGPPRAGYCSPWSSWATSGRLARASSSPPRVLDLGLAYVLSRNLREVARPHMESLVARTCGSSSIAQLDGPDIVYVAGEYLPLLFQTAGAISADWARYQSAPHVTVPPGALTASTAASRLHAAGQVSGQRTAG